MSHPRKAPVVVGEVVARSGAPVRNGSCCSTIDHRELFKGSLKSCFGGSTLVVPSQLLHLPTGAEMDACAILTLVFANLPSGLNVSAIDPRVKDAAGYARLIGILPDLASFLGAKTKSDVVISNPRECKRLSNVSVPLSLHETQEKQRNPATIMQIYAPVLSADMRRAIVFTRLGGAQNYYCVTIRPSFSVKKSLDSYLVP